MRVKLPTGIHHQAVSVLAEKENAAAFLMPKPANVSRTQRLQTGTTRHRLTTRQHSRIPFARDRIFSVSLLAGLRDGPVCLKAAYVPCSFVKFLWLDPSDGDVFDEREDSAR
jgi:hypothetical protein